MLDNDAVTLFSTEVKSKMMTGGGKLMFRCLGALALYCRCEVVDGVVNGCQHLGQFECPKSGD